MGRTNSDGIRHLQAFLWSSFHTKDLGNLTTSLGLQVHISPQGNFINQHKCTKDLIGLSCLENSTIVDSPLKVNFKYSKENGKVHSDPTIYRRLVGSLIILTITHQVISYTVNLASQFMTEPQTYIFLLSNELFVIKLVL